MRSMTLATVFVALAGYAVILVAARGLAPADYEIFMVFWGLFFALTGVLDGLMQETARGVTRRYSPTADASSSSASSPAATAPGSASISPAAAPAGAAPFRLTAFFALATAAAILLAAPWWASAVAPDHAVWAAALCAVGLGCYAFQATVCGLLSAGDEWPRFALLMAIDSGVRLALAIIAWQAGWHMVAFLIVTVLGAATWLLFLPDRTTRILLRKRTDSPPAQFARRSIAAMIASGANAVLITGFPVLLKFTTDATVTAGALAATITAVTLTRAPILVPLQRFQPALIVHFTRHRRHVLRASALPIAAVAGIAAVGGVAAYLVGQPLMALFFREDYLVSAEALAWLTVASGATAVLMITGSAALAAEQHGLYVAGWIIATVAAVAALLAFGSPEARSIAALSLGPFAGAVYQLAVLARSGGKTCSPQPMPAQP